VDTAVRLVSEETAVTTMPFDLQALRRGHEARDAQMLLGLYADDAEVRVVDQTHPPSHPLVLHGRDEIGKYLQDICDRDMVHVVHDELVGNGLATAHVTCRYADGTQVLAAETFELDDNGRIQRETIVQAWDQSG
jgi:hypothetical protein